MRSSRICARGKLGGLPGAPLAAAVVLVLSGCDGDRAPTTPGPPVPTIANVWPNEDGNGWTYGTRSTIWGTPPPGTLYPSPDDVPPIPSFDELEALLRRPVRSHAGGEPETRDGIFRLEFDGEATTKSGATGQNLRETIFYDNPRLPAGALPPEESFLARLTWARPDLRPLIAPRLARTGDPYEIVPLGPILIHGHAWEKNDSTIIGYGDLDTLPAWKFLETPLEPGHEFTHQLVPLLADDVFLRAQYRGIDTFEKGARVYENALEVLYVIDYGIMFVRDEFEEEKAYYRVFDYGTVVYAPEVGPVQSRERNFQYTSDPATPGVTLDVSILGASLPDDDPFHLALSGRVRLAGVLRASGGGPSVPHVIEDAGGVEVILERNGRQFAEVLTVDGSFVFGDLDAGDYRARVWVGASQADAVLSDASDVVTLTDQDVALADTLALSTTGGIEAIPNGFTQSTSIRYGLAQQSQVRLVIQDAARRAIAVLVDFVQPAGSHSVVWKPNLAPPGLYWAVLTHELGAEAALLIKEE